MKQLPIESNHQLGIGHGSHEGMVGKNNEDSYTSLCYEFVSGEETKTFYLNIVADGVGGQSAGERASQLTIDTIREYFDDLESVSVHDVLNHIDQAVSLANTVVYEEATNDDEFDGMATTIVLFAVLDGLLFTSHVGDSRVYFLREGVLYHLTKDHSWVQEAIDAGLLTPAQARRHPNKNIIRRSIGTVPFVEVDQELLSPWKPHFWQGMPLQHGDKILVCSDGLNDMILDADIKESLLNSAEKTQYRVEELIEKANRAGGRDNITVVLFEVLEGFRVNENPAIEPTERPDTPPPMPLNEEDPPTIRNMPPVTALPPSPASVPAPAKPLNIPSKSQSYIEIVAKQQRTAIIWILGIALVVLLVLATLYFAGVFGPPPPPPPPPTPAP